MAEILNLTKDWEMYFKCWELLLPLSNILVIRLSVWEDNNEDVRPYNILDDKLIVPLLVPKDELSTSTVILLTSILDTGVNFNCRAFLVEGKAT